MIFVDQVDLLKSSPDFTQQLITLALTPAQMQVAVLLYRSYGEGIARAFLDQMARVLDGDPDVSTVKGWPAEFDWVCGPRDEWPGRNPIPLL